ncbi:MULTISPECIES: ABC transporter substrate-binding protein [unclassified Hahella]|uniref:ABC transporter substrate-binding protein n=1 Tax=unclassified Hahella TaxID=2624107 RepID=UPI001C1EC49D|nr:MULTISPECIES: ABC transporter substrate-binding protein [unclassified Hahella]MBU6953694.1 ABC transporter substrate-binding protein [Hahella sp. HN01]MDG9671526.1 ABC transporter substrate-binding protein [Hahella sp. CR1]
MKKTLGIIAGAVLSLGLVNANAATLKLALDADPVSLDPHEQLSGGTLQLSHWLFDPLIRWTKDLTFEPRLAEKWERVDDLTMRFHLRKDVKFHSGNTFTAKDVKWTFDRLKQSPDFKGIFEPFADVKIVDDYTIDLVTKEPFPLVLNNATYLFPMDSAFYSGTDDNGQPKDLLVKHGNSFASRKASGTGPFTVSYREQGVKVEFARYPGYWDTKSPGNVDKMILTPIKEDPTRVAALLSGDVDYIAPVPPTDLKRIESDKNSKLVTMSGTRIITFQMNQNRRAEFKDPRVRLAINYAINQEAISDKIMKGFSTPAAQLSPKGYLGYNADLKPRFDLKKAKELMKEAGYEKGFSITMMAPNNRYVNDEKIAQAAAAMLAKINIKVDLKTLPKAQYWPEFDARSADIMMIGWHSDTEDSNNFYEFLVMCPNTETGAGQYNSGNYCNPKVDEMVKEANKVTDTKKRAEIMQNIEKTLYDEGAFIPLHWQDLAWASKKNVGAEEVLNVMDFPYFGDLVIK